MIVSHLLLILHKEIQFYIFMFVAKGRKVQGGRILSQGTVFTINIYLTQWQCPQDTLGCYIHNFYIHC
jgi:hypothetical protein